jgi:glycosyltransferase involved in cell wall biosynthesis
MANAPSELDNGGQPQNSAAAPAVQVQPTAPPVPKVIVVISTGWGPLYGGINSFSFDFSLALGRMLRGSVRVICLTTNVDDITRGKVKADHVEIFTLPQVGPGNESAVASNAREVLNQHGIAAIDLVFGHDVVTGPAAIELVKLMGGKAAVFHHMSYVQYQGVKKDGRTAVQMDEDQKSVLLKAHYVIAVGPLLKESAERLCQRNIPMVVPGMAAIPPVMHRAADAFRAITFGRMGGEDDPIKQGSLAVAGYGRYVKRAEQVRADRNHQFTMYGLPQAQYEAEEKALKELMRKEADRQIPVNATVYTDDRRKLFEALADNEVALMLSWHEGFGLVGWEAIAAGVPLVVSKRTGLYKLLNSPDDPVGAACVSVVDVRGSDTGVPNDADVTEVAAALLQIAVNWKDSYQKANTLRNHLARKYTWEGCARDALKACAFPLGGADPETATPQSATRAQEASAGCTAEEQHRLVCLDGGSKPTQEVMKVLSILTVCPTGLPLQVLSQATGVSCDSLRAMLSERLELASGQGDLWSIKDKSQVPENAWSPDLLADAFEALLLYIQGHKQEPTAWSQADNALELGKICIHRRHRPVAQLFKVLQKILKRRGDKRLVLAVAKLSLDAARRLPRDLEELKAEAMTRICGEAWAYQRLNQLADARAAADDSLRLGKNIPWDRNTAFCMKCIGRLLRIQAEQEQDHGARGKLLGESESHIREAIRLFEKLDEVGPNHPEVGDCYSLLGRTLLFSNNRREAAKAANKARELLTDQSDKDYLDLCLLAGDLEAAGQRFADAEAYYEEVLGKIQTGDAEKSEIYARAYLARGKSRLALGRKEHAIADFDRAAKIWHQLEDTYNASRAEWARIKVTGGLKPAIVALLEKESYPVRVEAYRLQEIRSQVGSGKAIAKRAEPSKTAWIQMVQEAKQKVAIEEKHW